MSAGETATKGKGGGCGPVTIFLVILVIIGAILGVNMGIGVYGVNCGDEPVWDCIERIMNENPDEDETETVTASGPYTYDDYSVVVTANIPLSGGAVTGSISGACSGRVTGNFDGADNGSITGKIVGTCNVFFVNVPASANFSGTVNKAGKSVPIGFTGSGAGFSHDGSMVLAY